MCNVEQLTLFIGIKRLNHMGFLDGKQLENDFITHLSHLRKFRFSFHTSLFHLSAFVDQPSSVDVQRSFRRSIFDHVGSYVDDRREQRTSTCHVYSLPFVFKTCTRLSRSFPGGTFNRVRVLWVSGCKPLQNGFFKKILDSFPHLEQLFTSQFAPLSDKQNSNINTLPIILVPRLKYLDIHGCHMDYVEQLLSDAASSLPSLGELHVDYTSLSTVTNDFTNDLARLNCAKVRILGVNECIVPSENCVLYFPSLEILSK